MSGSQTNKLVLDRNVHDSGLTVETNHAVAYRKHIWLNFYNITFSVSRAVNFFYTVVTLDQI